MNDLEYLNSLRDILNIHSQYLGASSISINVHVLFPRELNVHWKEVTITNIQDTINSMANHLPRKTFIHVPTSWEVTTLPEETYANYTLKLHNVPAPALEILKCENLQKSAIIPSRFGGYMVELRELIHSTTLGEHHALLPNRK